MQQIITDIYNGTINISNIYDPSIKEGNENATPYLDNIGDSYTIEFDDLQGVESLDTFVYDTLNLTENRYIDVCYRISYDKEKWTDWLEMNNKIANFPTTDPNNLLYIQIKFTRVGTNMDSFIRLLSYNIDGTIARNVIIAEGSELFKIQPNTTVILCVPYIYKVFKLVNFDIIPNGVITEDKIQYRYSQDNSRSWSEWEYLTKDNITTAPISPTRFFQIEYKIINDGDSKIKLQDILLIGDFQNVSKDYYKTNLFGVRENCNIDNGGYYDENGNYITLNGTVSGTSSSSDSSITTNICANNNNNLSSTADTSNYYKPYNLTEAQNLLNTMSNDAVMIFGHDVIYFCTDPDTKGQDFTLHEYQLYNVVCKANMKVAVENNMFPDSQIVFNQFNLDMFETMTINITKQMFKTAFGPQRRPSKEDFIYFCKLNRMYQIEHAQPYRNFNNYAVYYKIVLKKFNQKKNINTSIDEEISNLYNKLTKNTTIDSLFGKENERDKKAIANKPQTRTTTDEMTRLECLATIENENIYNSTTIISKHQYNLSYNNKCGYPVVLYKRFNNIMKKSDNIGYMMWFKFNKDRYVADEVYTFFQYYDIEKSLGWTSYLYNDVIYVVLNNKRYEYKLTKEPLQPKHNPKAFNEDVWYCYVLNINQRQRKMEQYIYKRDVDIVDGVEDDASLLTSTILRQIYKDTQPISPIFYELDKDNYMSLLSSEMKVTNIRLFNDVIPENVHNKICNQYILGDDAKYLIFADNATKKLELNRFIFT